MICVPQGLQAVAGGLVLQIQLEDWSATARGPVAQPRRCHAAHAAGRAGSCSPEGAPVGFILFFSGQERGTDRESKQGFLGKRLQSLTTVR